MNLLNDVRKSITDAADTIVEKGQQLGELARLQIAMKKLQVDRAKRLHELGSRAYALYQVEKLLAQNPLPREIHELCEPIEEIDRQMESTQQQMDAAAQSACAGHASTEEAAANGNGAVPDSPSVTETFVTQVAVEPNIPTPNAAVPPKPVETPYPVAAEAGLTPNQTAELLKRIELLERQIAQTGAANSLAAETAGASGERGGGGAPREATANGESIATLPQGTVAAAEKGDDNVDA